MSCLEKRHVNYRVGNMLHHRFPNGFTDLSMDDTDREVSTLTERAFRSLCVGDDAVYNDDFLYGYSPFSCHKPLVGEPAKKTHHKEFKKHVQHKNHKHDTQLWKEQQKKNISQMSSFLQVFNATEEGCDRLLITNGGAGDSNGESWDKSALRSIQRELSEFSSDYHNSLTHKHSGGGLSNKKSKDLSLPTGKSSKLKNGKSTIKLKKLNIKNFFLHSEFSPFQTWKDLHRFPFSQEDADNAILPTDGAKWFDMPFYKELTEAHRKATVGEEEAESCQKEKVEPPPVPAPKPNPPPPPPKVLPKPSVTMAEKRCTSEGEGGIAAPWRRNRSRAKSAIPVNHPGMPLQEHTKTMDDNPELMKKDFKSVQVKAVNEVSSVASTPFSICQLMTPLIPSRQPTETSEILQGVLSPLALDLPLRPQSEAKVTPEPLIKRDSYKALASSILFNLKDNRKRVKSRYSPPKFKTLDLPESATQSPQSDVFKQDETVSGLSTPAIWKDGLPVCGPDVEPTGFQSVDVTKSEPDRPISDDYLLSNLLTTKREALGNNSLGEESPNSPYLLSKNIKSPMTRKQNYPSLNLYKKSSPVDSPQALSEQKQTISVTEKTIWNSKDGKLMTPEVQPNSKEKDIGSERVSTKDVIRAAREAINAVKNKALLATASDSIIKLVSDSERLRQNVVDEQSSKREGELPECNNDSYPSQSDATVKKAPPPVPKRTLTKSDIHSALEKQQLQMERVSNGECEETKSDSSTNEIKSVGKPIKQKHIFSAKQNNYIKNQRYAKADEEDECDEGHANVNMKVERGEMALPGKETKDGEHIFNDLQALKELQKARFGERMLENARAKLTISNIEEEAKAKNDLISRELRNMKRGMLSMRGNTSAKRDIFVKKEKEQNQLEVFSKVDGNVRVNKALINDNYDKAKMALEEIITEREKRKLQPVEQERNLQNCRENINEKTEEQCPETPKDPCAEPKEDPTNNGSVFKKTDVKERLTDLRDHNHLRHILAQTEPGLDEIHRFGGRAALPGMDRTAPDQSLKPEPSYVKPNCVNVNPKSEKDEINEKSREKQSNESESRKFDAPPIPPRSKRGSSRSDDSITSENDKTGGSVLGSNRPLDVVEASLKEMEKISEFQKESEKEVMPKRSYSEQVTANCDLDMKYNHRLSPHEKTVSPIIESFAENTDNEENENSIRTQNSFVIPDHTTRTKDQNALSPVVQEDSKTKSATQSEVTPNEDVPLVETHKNVFSPLLLINGVTVCQSPPDQASLSSKSSYFSVESAHYRNPETEPNVYHSLENLTGEVEVDDQPLVSQTAKQDPCGAEVEYYSLSDPDCEPEISKQQIKSPPKLSEVPQNIIKERETKQILSHDGNTTSPSSTFSPTLGIPSLFKVKDNTFTHKLKKTVQPWSPRGSISYIESVEEEPQEIKLNLSNNDETQGSTSTLLPTENTEESHLNQRQPLLSPPLMVHNQTQKKPQTGNFLTIPQEEDRFSGVSPSSEGRESAADTADELVMSNGGVAEGAKVLSDGSGSTCNTKENQTGLPKPPAVLPKSEKAVLKAIKIANRRMKKEEAQNSSQKSVQNSSKSKSQKPKGEKSAIREGSKTARSGEKKHKEKAQGENPNYENNHGNNDNQAEQRGSNNRAQYENTRPKVHKTDRQSYASAESQKGKGQLDHGSERQGRSSSRHIRDKPELRQCSNDRVISNLPVYKAHVGESPMADRSFHRTQSIDRYMGGNAERRLSSDMSANEKLESKNQRVDEIQQRGRTREQPGKDSRQRRSHSIDVYSTEVPRVLSLSRQSSHSSQLSRQSSHTSQLSRQSSIEHAIIAQPIPLTQRKLLQDPDSGQYFFVDMPVQVRTKTFFDPETGNYVQLPVQPPEGAVPQVSPMEVLPSPVVVYHSFVPVPLSPMAQTATISVPRVEPDEFDQRNLERSRLRAHRYLEPVYGQHDIMLGEFKGTEELDCPS